MPLNMDTATLQAALVGYQQQIAEIEQKMQDIRRQLGKSGGRAAKRSSSGNGGNGNAAQTAGPRRHRMSAEGRARIAAAQRARWAKAKRAAKKDSD